MPARKRTVENGKIPERQEQVAALLASGYTQARACRECKVGATTVNRWLKDPAFQQRVSELRRQLTERAIGRLADMMAGEALDTLRKLLARSKSDTVKLDAVRTVFEKFLDVTNAAELKDRIERLEAMQ